MQTTTQDTVQLAVLKEFRQIPGIGKSLALDLWNLGFRSLQELRGQDPEEMYVKQCALQGTQVDRCVLYTFRCAVYYASHTPEQRDPELLKWWHWKDTKIQEGK